MHHEEPDVTALLGLPEPSGWCGGGKCGHLQRKDIPSSQKVMKFSCGGWRCRICGRRLRWENGHWFGWRLVLADGTLHEEELHADKWGAVRQRLQHHGCSWVCIDGGRGVRNVLYSRPTEPDGVVSFVGREEAVARLGALLRSMEPVRQGKKCQPITSSADWKRGKRTPASAYTLLRWVKVKEPEPLAEQLRSLGIEPTIRRDEGSSVWSVTFTAPPNGLPHQIFKPGGDDTISLLRTNP